MIGRDPAPRATAAAFAVAAACSLPALAQISPGKLSEPHAKLGGSLDCMNCHDAEQGVSPDRCLGCHQPLRKRISHGKGLHAQPDYRDCRKCHIEHHGREFELIWWGEPGRAAFDHALTGYELEGAHTGLRCRECHVQGNIHDRGPLIEQGKDLDRTYLGLDAGCLSCHADVHKGQYEQEACESCHSMNSWKPANRFDHATTSYSLLGRHRTVPCAGCHLPAGVDEEVAGPEDLRFRGVAAAHCTDRHRDEHRGQLQPDACDSCHTADGWQPTSFDHEKSAYPLTGRHRQVDCHKCHLTIADPASDSRESYRLLRGVAHGACTDCHEDKHAGRLGPACAECHGTASWATIGTTGFDHGRTRYPLEGRHVAVECEGCHLPGRPLAITEFDRCAACHADTHAGQFVAREDAGACEPCHDVEGFRPSRYTLAAHQSSRFPLDGGHGAIPCDRCHRMVDPAIPGQSTAATERVRRFRFQSLRCIECHDDPHHGQLDRFMAERGCAGCHAVAGWTSVAFDHGRTTFPLEGAHAETNCGQCHLRSPGEATGVRRWTGFGTRCEDCHPDPHGGQFQRPGQPTDCRGCHRPVTWESLLFEHDRDSGFPLKGAHVRTACRACHRVEEAGRGAMVRYRPLASDCASCHDNPRRLKEDP